jgi:iron(III) transport system permease protein
MEKIKNASRNLKINPGALLVRIILLWLIVTFVLYPNINLLVNVFFKNGEFSTSVFYDILKSERAIQSLKNSFILAFSMVITVNIVGTLIVLFTEYWKIKGFGILKLGYMSSLVYSGIVLVTGYKFVYGADGIFTKFLANIFPSMNTNWFVGYGAVIFIMTFACTSNHIMFLSKAVRSLDYYTIEAAKNMGASGSMIFFKVVLPTLKPTFFAITILTFLTGLGAMSAPLIVGGTSFQTINPMIIAFAKMQNSREIAALLAVILGSATIVILAIFNKIEKSGNYSSISKTKARLVKQKINNPVLNFIAHMTAYLLFIIYMLPICSVILFSFSDNVAIKTGKLSLDTLTFENYRMLFTQNNVFKPFFISIVYSFSAAIIVVIIAIAVTKIVYKAKNKFDSFFEYSILIPWLLPSTFIALGFMITYDVPRWFIGNKVLIGTWVLLLIAYVVVHLPFSFRMIRSTFFSIDDNLEEAAKCMGAGTIYSMVKVTLPVILPSILSVVAIVFNSMLADYDLSVFLYQPFLQPLGIAIKSASDETASGNAQAMMLVYSAALIIISSITLYLTQGEGMNNVKKWISYFISKKQMVNRE